MIFNDTTNEPKITGLRLSWDHDPHRDIGRTEAAEGLAAAMRPFGSLTTCAVDVSALAALMLDAVDRPDATTGAALISAVHSTHDDHCGVTLSPGYCALITPTSGTEIRVVRSPYRYRVTVDFGPCGSRSRADEITDATAGHLRWIDIDEGMTPPPVDLALAQLQHAYAVAVLAGAIDAGEPEPGWVRRAIKRAQAEDVLPSTDPLHGYSLDEIVVDLGPGLHR